MFDRLEDIIKHFEEIQRELGQPDVAADPNRFRKLMKEQNDLQPLVETYTQYKKEKTNVEDSLELLDLESDPEMRELAKEELAASRKAVEELEEKQMVEL